MLAPMRTAGMTIGAVMTAIPATAVADRDVALGVTGGVAIHGRATMDEDGAIAGYLGASVTLDRSPPPLPTTPGHAWRGELVPELTLASFAQRAMALGGVRLELDWAQREQGLLRSSGRGSMWIAPRLGVLEGADTLVVGLDAYGTMRFGRGAWAIGYGGGVLLWGQEPEYVIQDGGSIAIVGAEVEPETHLAVIMGLTVTR